MANSGNRSSAEHLHIALVGKTGDGKSKLGNVLLQKEAFKSVQSAQSVTFSCESATAVRDDGTQLTVIDTPGTMDNRDQQAAEKNLEQAAFACPDGLHAFLLVTKYGRFTKESREAIETLAEVFGEDLFRYVIVVFTHAEEFDDRKQFDEAIKRDVAQNEDLRVILKKCSNRATFIDNGRRCDTQLQASQVKEILSMVRQVHKDNNGKYTNWLFQKAQELLLKKKREEEEERRRKEELKQREAQLSKELEEHRKEMNEMRAQMQRRENAWWEEKQAMKMSQKIKLDRVRAEIKENKIEAENRLKQQKAEMHKTIDEKTQSSCSIL